jgi:hypothetical protein
MNSLSPLPPREPDATAKKGDAVQHEGLFDSDGRFSLVMRDHTVTSGASTDDGASRLILRVHGGEENDTRPYLSLVMIVERTFRALGLSPFGSGKKRLLFWFWIIFFCVQMHLFNNRLARSNNSFSQRSQLIPCAVQPSQHHDIAQWPVHQSQPSRHHHYLRLHRLDTDTDLFQRFWRQVST